MSINLNALAGEYDAVLICGIQYKTHWGQDIRFCWIHFSPSINSQWENIHQSVYQIKATTGAYCRRKRGCQMCHNYMEVRKGLKTWSEQCQVSNLDSNFATYLRDKVQFWVLGEKGYLFLLEMSSFSKQTNKQTILGQSKFPELKCTVSSMNIFQGFIVEDIAVCPLISCFD